MSLCAEFRGKAEFLVVYLEEAHPTDGWMFGGVSHMIEQHTSLEARRAAARIMQREMDTHSSCLAAEDTSEEDHGAAETIGGPELLVDTMENLASVTFGALPERLLVLVEGRVVFLGGKGPEDYSVKACREALGRMLA
mmetsp:Transcript_64820/g.130350  ORF Transcript_64820/g.130350 Transcript_64820/m.130350 type:complete len:138 (-) Transcript_64820:63-476(-)